MKKKEMDHFLIVQMPSAPPEQLFLLFHGVGGTALDMRSLGEMLASHYPNAAVVCVGGAFASDINSGGRQWFSVRGISEENRIERVSTAMPKFIEQISHWQETTDVPPEKTALIGFSQGAIMLLELSKLQPTRTARIVSVAGRFAALPTDPIVNTFLHLIHGKDDNVIAYQHTIDATHRLLALGSDIIADVLPMCGHTMSAEVCSLIIERLRRVLPQSTWHKAMVAAS
jgi:phospholipase/carboxylesterase